MPVPLKPPTKPSSLIAEHGYDLASQTLAIRFHGGALYRYHDVEPEKHERFLTAESIGKFFGSEIRGKHRHELVPAEHEGATPA